MAICCHFRPNLLPDAQAILLVLLNLQININMRAKQFLIFTLTVCLVLFVTTQIDAQCPMCRMSAESNLKNGGTMGRGLNTGILYMLAAPYIIVASIGFWWWKNKSKPQVTDQLPEEI